MNAKKCNKRLLIYELWNILGNPFTACFGILFPAFMLMIIAVAMKQQMPVSMLQEANTQVFITISMIIPMAVVLLGHSANYSQELEKGVSDRMQLFGFKPGSMMLAKVVTQVLAMTLGLVFYTVFAYVMLDLQKPSWTSAFCLILCQYLFGILYFILAHALSNIFKKFGPTYAVTMSLYFLTMILCGMMGIQTEQLPKVLKGAARLLPMSYVSSDFIEFWQKGSYNFGPFIQALLFFGAVCCLLLLFANYKNRRVLK